MSSRVDIADKCVNVNDFIIEKIACNVQPVFDYELMYIPLSPNQPLNFSYENKLPALRQSSAYNYFQLYQRQNE